MSIKIQSIGSLFVALVIILAINPTIVHNMYGSILGRLFLILIVIFFAINNITLGLLIVLTIITALNQYGSLVEARLPLVEGMGMGMESGSGVTIGEDNTNVTGEQPLKKKKKDETIGIDKENLKITMMSKDSNQIPVNNMNISTDVNAASPDMLSTEGFLSFAKV